ncbi:MAG: hypothetical protein HETSPECPRED_006312 [Heterodermia speciosa]|uniref:Uncharacterized protein n=1 Tax=Heterodermia speciosa TaxID=116794 RepID=A0A8H3FM68_9LECA|nr:MAG: hypothetical protein HETSPECPRED_006312 [Heterodermia speciosa]
MRSGLYLSGWLIATAFASPLVVDIGPRVKDSDSDRSHNLSRAPLPWGPKEFGFETKSEGRNALDPRSLYGLALLMATMLAIGDFEGELPNNPATFVNIAFPHIGAAVYRPNPREPVPRKYVHWGLARVMNHIIREQDYKDNIYSLFWTDPNRATRKVGELYIGPSPPRMGVGNGGSQTASSLLPQALNSTEIVLGAGSQPTNGTQASIHGSSNSLTYQYDYHGDEMTVEDVVMGTLGSINEAAQFHDRSGHTTVFVGSFPRYYAFCVWTGGPGFTYSILIQSLRQAATAAMSANNFHELSIVLRNNGVEIARGGYISKPEPDRTSASVATS